jgi:hypothetical protein
MKKIYQYPQTEIIPVQIESQLCSGSKVGFTSSKGSGAGL